MAYAVGQEKSIYDANTALTSVATGNTSGNITAGSMLFAFVSWSYDADVTAAMSDATGSEDSWTQLGAITPSFTGSNKRNAAFYRLNATGGSLLNATCTFTGGVVHFPKLHVVEFTGINALLTHAWAQRSTPGTGTDAIASATTGTLSEQPALIVGALGYNTDTIAAGTGNTLIGASAPKLIEHKRVTVTTATTATFTDATNGSVEEWAVIVAAFSEGGGTPPITDGPKLVSVRSNIRFN
jgi:hypothetical protein